MLCKFIGKIKAFVKYGLFGLTQHDNDFMEFWEVLEFKLNNL